MANSEEPVNKEKPVKASVYIVGTIQHAWHPYLINDDGSCHFSDFHAMMQEFLDKIQAITQASSCDTAMHQPSAVQATMCRT